MRLNVVVLLQVVSLSEDKMPVDWHTEEMRKWMDLTKKEQQKYYDTPHIVKWRNCKLSDSSNLKKIIRCAIFDVSEKEPVENFTDEQLKLVNKLFVSIKKSMKRHKDEESVCVSVLFVLAKAADGYLKLPVIKLQYNNIFIDFCGRVYKNWKDYLKNNTLSKCIICYPKNGVYSVVNDVVEVEYGISPAGRAGRKFLRRLDIAGTVLGVTATGVGIAAMCFPVALPVVAG